MNQPNDPTPSPEEDTSLTANALKAMAHPLRWKILCSLGENELSVGEIVERTGTSQSNIPSTWSSFGTRISWFRARRPTASTTASAIISCWI